MNLLLDTHVALWAVGGNPRLPSAARVLIADPTNTLAVSVVTLWEIAIKHARKGAPEMPVSASEAEIEFRRAGFSFLELKPSHAIAIGNLPAIHADPFDRMLIAQALTEPMRLVTSDKTVAEYDGSVILT